MSASPLLAFYGDDFTGSTDALEFLTRAGARTVLFTTPPTPEQLARFPRLDAVGVAGMTRALAPEEIERELRPAFAALRTLGVPHVHYKVCSTFDSSPTVGSIGRAIDIGAETFGARFVPLLVGAPALGRYTVFGHHFARLGTADGAEVFRLDRHPSMSRHPTTPMVEADLRVHLAKQTDKRIGLFNVLALDGPADNYRAVLDALLPAGAEVVLFDILRHDHLARIGALLDAHANEEHPLFSVGSSGVDAALGAHWAVTGRLQPRDTWPELNANGPVLVASGSCSPVTARQIARAVAGGFVEVPIDPVALRGSAGTVALDPAAPTPGHITALLRAGRSVIVHTGGTATESLPASVVGSTLGALARTAVAQTNIHRLVIAGGDTSSYAARTLGIEALEMLAPLAPGAPLCRAHASASPIDGREIVFKGGQVGGEDFFLTTLS